MYVVEQMSNICMCAALSLPLALTVLRDRRPPVRPREVPVRSHVDHRLDGERVPHLHHALGLVARVVGHVGRAVEEVPDPVPAVGLDHAQSLPGRVLTDDGAQVAVARAGLAGRDGLHQTLVRSADQSMTGRERK